MKQACLWKNFQESVFDHATGLDKDAAAKEPAAFAVMDAPHSVITVQDFEILTKTLQIEVGSHDFPQRHGVSGEAAREGTLDVLFNQ